MANEDIEALISDQDMALQQWYQGFMSPANPESTLTGGPHPSFEKISDIFQQWFERRRNELRGLLCEKLQYMKLQPARLETLEITIVATVSTIIATSHLSGQVDPVATAALLLSRRSLDELCDKVGTTDGSE